MSGSNPGWVPGYVPQAAEYNALWGSKLDVVPVTLHAATIAALRGLVPTTTNSACVVDSYATLGDRGGGTFSWAATDTRADDGIMVIQPTAIVGSDPGRWQRVIEGGHITPEMAGAVGDYVFPSGGAGEVLGTDNTAAFTAAFQAAGWNTEQHGGTVKLQAGRRYRIAGTFFVPDGVTLQGDGYSLNSYMTNSNPALEQIFDLGSSVVIEPTASFEMAQFSRMANVRLLRRGLDTNPTTAQVKALWTAAGQELCGGKMWLPLTAVTAGTVRVNNSNVYVCDTSGTTGAVSTGGPRGETTSTDSIIDGSAKWHWLNQLSWTPSTGYVAGTVVTSGPNVYLCDTGGTSGTSPYGPTGTVATTNGITDGTAKWHYVQAFSVGVYVTGGIASIVDCTIVGFAKGILAPFGVNVVRDVYADNWCNLDLSGTGDTNVIDHVHCVPIYLPSADAPPDLSYWRKQWCSFDLHDRTDSAILNDCESEGWAVGIRLSNVWAVNVSRARLEHPLTPVYDGDAGFRLRNVVSYAEFADNYVGCNIGYDIGAVSYTHASTPGGLSVESSLHIHGGNVGSFTGVTGSTPFLISGNSRGQISGVQVNVQGNVSFTFQPYTNGGGMFWLIDNIRLDEDVVAQTWTSMQSTDSSAAPYVHFSNIWDANLNRWVLPPGFDDSCDLVSSPTTGGSHTVAAGVSWCHLTPSGTLATYTITMPAVPADKAELVISSSAALTALTVSPNTGQTIDAAPTTLAAHGAVRFKYLAASTKWVRLIMS